MTLAVTVSSLFLGRAARAWTVTRIGNQPVVNVWIRMTVGRMAVT